MADENKETPKIETPAFPDAAKKNNAEVAAKLAAQDVMGKSTAADPAGDAGEALDKLAEQYSAPKEGVKEEKTGAKPAEAAKVEEKLKAETKTAPEAKPEPTAEEKAAAAEREAQKKRADELFKGAPTLPANASPKSSEAFSAIKMQAAKEISAREAEIEKLRAEAKALEEKLKNAAPPEALKELEEHRQWRAKLDIEVDPKFKAFDQQISQAREFVYSQLKKSPAITDDVIKEIKKYGGPDFVNIPKLLAATNDPTLQRIVEAKLADIEMLKFNKQQAIDTAKKDVQGYLKQREEQYVQAATQHTAQTKTHLDPMLKQLEWLNPKEVTQGATEDEKKQIAEHNDFVKTTRDQLEAAIKDDSAEMRAILLTGMAQLFNLQRLYPAAQKENETLKAQVAELTSKLDRIKSASVSHLRETSIPAGSEPKVPKKQETIFNTPATQALDDIAKQVMEERERAASASH